MGSSYHMEMLAALVFQGILSIYHPAGGMQLCLLTTPPGTPEFSEWRSWLLSPFHLLSLAWNCHDSEYSWQKGSSPGLGGQGSFPVHFPVWDRVLPPSPHQDLAPLFSRTMYLGPPSPSEWDRPNWSLYKQAFYNEPPSHTFKWLS